MSKIKILNEASEDEAQIEIFGAIGQGWFDEGNTIQTVSEKIKAIKAPRIKVLVASLGGDAAEGLGIYSLLKTLSDKHITTVIEAPTASAGTIVALGGDEVLMSDAALFLVHPVWTIAAGNADELRKEAENLDVWDERLAAIYQKKTGKRKSQLQTLMSENRWLSPQDAKEWGFVDKVFEGKKVAASVVKDINASEIVPKLTEDYIKKFAVPEKGIVGKVLDKLGITTEEKKPQAVEVKPAPVAEAPAPVVTESKPVNMENKEKTPTEVLLEKLAGQNETILNELNASKQKNQELTEKLLAVEQKLALGEARPIKPATPGVEGEERQNGAEENPFWAFVAGRVADARADKGRGRAAR